MTLRAAALAVALAASPAVALAAQSTPVRVVNDCEHARTRPKRIVIACGDGTEVLTRLHWSVWKRSEATGAGTDEVDSCNPDCAAGRPTPYPVTVRLERPKVCAHRAYPVFTRAVLEFGPARPHGRRSETDQFPCQS